MFAFILNYMLTAIPAGAKNNPADSSLHQLQSIKDINIRMQAIYDTCTIKYGDNPRAAFLFARAFLKENEAYPTDSNSVKANYLMGDAALMSGRYEEALQYCIKALGLAERLHMYDIQTNILSDISGIYLRMGNAETSMEKINEALAVARMHQLPVNEARLMDMLGIRYAMMGQYDKAFNIYDAALVKAKELRLYKLVMNILIDKGTTYRVSGKHDQALTSTRQALHMADSLASPNDIALLHLQIGQLYAEMHQLGNAERECRLALSNSRDIADPLFSLAVYGAMSAIYEQKGDFKSALDYKKRELDLKDSAFNIERTAQISELQTRYDTEVKDNKLAAQSAQIRSDRKTNLLLWTSLGALGLIGAVIYISQRRTKRLYTRIVRQQEDLRSKTKELERMNNVKDRLFSTISHDMRAPVSSLMSFIMLLDQGNISSEKLTLYAADLKQSLGFTTTLMENLLNFARSQMKGYHAKIEVLNLTAITVDAVALAQPEATMKGITLRNELTTDINVMADINMLALIVRNLLGNAIKFTRPGGNIILSAGKTTDGFGYLEISDDGIGIDASLVEAFNQSATADKQPLEHTPGTAAEKGTGLGLMLSKTFLALMGGRIMLRSKKGRGSIFTVYLPVAK